MNNEAGQWQIDEQGRKYRHIGNIKEYAQERHFANSCAGQALERKAREAEQAKLTGKSCPFKGAAFSKCLTDCALYGKTACALTMKETPPDKDTSGGNCPIYRRQCNEKCALYFNGCGLIKIVKGLNAGKEN